MPSTTGGNEIVELQQKLARVQGLLEASRRVHSTIRLDEVLAMTLEIAAKELEAEGAFFALTGGRLGTRGNHVHGCVPDDWTRWTDCVDMTGYVSAPLTGERGETIAHLVTYRPAALSFEEADFLEGLAHQAALAIGNAQHHERMIEWERVRADLDAARAIQRSLLPQSVPEVPGYSLALRSTTCYEVGGDYVDVIPLEDGRLMMVLADVAGKGLASAMISMTFRSSFRAMSGAGLSLHEIAGRLNTLHWQEGIEARRRYVTAILLCLDRQTHRVDMVNSGHNPAFLKGATGVRTIGASGPPLGMLPGRTYETETFTIAEGEQLLLYTDGLTEVFQGDEEFGEERLQGLLADKPNDHLLDHIWAVLARFSGNARQTDDMTALYLYRGGVQ
ncbi:MAG: serine/threonine-protein phosphatase [Acidobacteria bacterium]|nr:serine/threonine-protein phosphatase [Acidobacteriota bacterium]